MHILFLLTIWFNFAVRNLRSVFLLHIQATLVGGLDGVILKDELNKTTKGHMSLIVQGIGSLIRNVIASENRNFYVPHCFS